VSGPRQLALRGGYFALGCAQCSTTCSIGKMERSFSGRFVIRLTPDLHAHLAEQASGQGVSLNLYVATLLAGASGFKKEDP